MIALESIDLASLPSVALCDRAQLPTTPAVYLAIDDLGIVQYIGATKNLCQRWRQHHKQVEISQLQSARIAYLSCPVDLVEEVEAALIEWFKPPLNQRIHRYCVERRSKPGAWEESKVRVQIMLTPTALALVDEDARVLHLSRSEVIERLVRNKYMTVQALEELSAGEYSNDQP